MTKSVDEIFLQAFENAQDAIVLVDDVSGSLVKLNRIAKTWWGNAENIDEVFDAESLRLFRLDRSMNETKVFPKSGKKPVLWVFSMLLSGDEHLRYRMFFCKADQADPKVEEDSIESMRGEFGTDCIHRISRNIKNTMQATQLAVEQTGANFYGLNELIKNIQHSLLLAEHMLSIVPSLYAHSGWGTDKRVESTSSRNTGVVDMRSLVSRLIPLMEFRIGRKVETEIETTSKGIFLRGNEGNVGYLLLAIADYCCYSTSFKRLSPLQLKISATGDQIEVAMMDSQPLQGVASNNNLWEPVGLGHSSDPGIQSDCKAGTIRNVEPSMEQLRRMIVVEGGQLVEDHRPSGVRRYRIKFPNVIRESNSVEKRRRSASFGLPVFLSSRDPNLLLNMRIAARKASFAIESGTAAPVSLFAKMCRYAGWIVDLENSDRATVLPILEKLVFGQAPVPVLLVEPSHRNLEHRAWTILDGFSAIGAPIIRRPFQAEAIAEQLLLMKVGSGLSEFG